MAKLDRTKDFGEVFGSMDGVRYVQGDKAFDTSGEEIGAKPAPKATKPVKVKPLDLSEVEAQLAEQLKDLT